MRRAICVVGVLVFTIACESDSPVEESETVPVEAVDTGAGTIVRLDPAFDELVPREAVIEHLADGFGFTEGPHWIDGDEVLCCLVTFPGIRFFDGVPLMVLARSFHQFSRVIETG